LLDLLAKNTWSICCEDTEITFYDFFSGDIISSAKDLLVSIINDLKMAGAPVITRRRPESKENIENRIKSDIDDVYFIIVYLDEQKLCDN